MENNTNKPMENLTSLLPEEDSTAPVNQKLDQEMVNTLNGFINEGDTVEDIAKKIKISDEPLDPKLSLGNTMNKTPNVSIDEDIARKMRGEVPVEQAPPTRKIGVAKGPVNKDEYERVTAGDLRYEEAQKQSKQAQVEELTDIAGLIKGATKREEDRIENAVEVTKTVYGTGIDPSHLPDIALANKDVVDETPEESTTTEAYHYPDEETVVDNTTDEIDMSEFVPDDYEEEKEEVIETTAKDMDGREITAQESDIISDIIDDADMIEEETLSGPEYLKSLPTVRADVQSEVIVRVENKANHMVIESKKDPTPMNDKAFLNSLNRYKKKTANVVTIPMPNSGFYLDIRGGGIIDVTELYQPIHKDIPTYEYDIAKMSAMVKNIVSTRPKIDPYSLMGYIHQHDFALLSLAYCHATLDTFTIPVSCTNIKCNSDFKIEATPGAMITNLDEIIERAEQFKEAKDIRTSSPLSKRVTLYAEDGTEIELGHPSFLDNLSLLNIMKKHLQTDPEIGKKIGERILFLTMVRKIKLPTGEYTNNPYQVYHALSVLTITDLQMIAEEAKKLYDEILVPKLGMENIACPDCGHVIPFIPITNMEDLVFYRTITLQQ